MLLKKGTQAKFSAGLFFEGSLWQKEDSGLLA